MCLLLRPPKPPALLRPLRNHLSPLPPFRFVRMAYLAVVASHTVNGVAAIHSEIIKVRGGERVMALAACEVMTASPSDSHTG